MNGFPHRLLRRLTAWLAVLAGAAALLRAETPDVGQYERDLGFLSAKVAQYGYQLKGSKDGASRLATMESALTRLRSILAELKDLAGEIEAKERRMEYYKTMELGPKEREVARIRQTANAELEQLYKEMDAHNVDVRRHNAIPHVFTPDQAAASAAYRAEYEQLNARGDDIERRTDAKRDEWNKLLLQAVQDYAKVQQEFGEVATKRDQAGEKFQSRASDYQDARGAVVSELVALDQAPPAPVSVPLTPFAQGVSPDDAGTVPLARPAIGPGNNVHAIDQLRVVVQSSRDAAGRDAQDRDVTNPPDETKKQDSSYTFDTGGGTGMAAMPDVGTPEAQAMVVPLEVPPPPAEQPTAPPAVKSSPVVEAFTRQRTEGLSRLEQLYKERQDLRAQGAQASPQDWTRVVNGISSAQADINQAGVGLKLSEGSALLDLTIVPKSQKKLSDLTVPPPPPPSK